MSGELHVYALLLLVGFLPNEIWRMLGLVVARGSTDPSSSRGRAVAVAVLAGVIAKLILFPPGRWRTPVSIRLAPSPAACRIPAVRRSAFAGVLPASCPPRRAAYGLRWFSQLA
jgi:hypothetical protein